MKIQFDILTKTRAIVLHYISELNLDQMMEDTWTWQKKNPNGYDE